jgi:hypothetical protein
VRRGACQARVDTRALLPFGAAVPYRLKDIL